MKNYISRIIATAGPQFILYQELELISGPNMSLLVKLAKCDSSVNYIPEQLKTGIFSKIILKVFVGLIAMETCQTLLNTKFWII